MMQELVESHAVDENGNPTGGRTGGVGIEINWQNGPLGRHADGCKTSPYLETKSGCVEGCGRAPQNGAFVEGVIAAAKKRLEFFQTASGGRFASRDNALAITKLDEALHWLHHRTQERQARQVEGTHAA